MFEKTYYATHPDMMIGPSNQDLRDRHLVSNLFRTGSHEGIYGRLPTVKR